MEQIVLNCQLTDETPSRTPSPHRSALGRGLGGRPGPSAKSESAGPSSRLDGRRDNRSDQPSRRTGAVCPPPSPGLTPRYRHQRSKRRRRSDRLSGRRRDPRGWRRRPIPRRRWLLDTPNDTREKRRQRRRTGASVGRPTSQDGVHCTFLLPPVFGPVGRTGRARRRGGGDGASSPRTQGGVGCPGEPKGLQGESRRRLRGKDRRKGKGRVKGVRGAVQTRGNLGPLGNLQWSERNP